MFFWNKEFHPICYYEYKVFLVSICGIIANCDSNTSCLPFVLVLSFIIIGLFYSSPESVTSLIAIVDAGR